MSRLKKKDYSKLTKEELIHELENVLNGKKYGLVWEDKPEDVAEMCKNNFPILEPVNEKDIRNDETGPTNIMIEGDNYHALSVLNYTHAGKIDVIYIDPPYNTGARDWKYNNDYVDNTDTFRHSKWISFMDKRLRLAKNLLKDEGVICVTIDDYELPRLWMSMEEIFGPDHHLGTLIVRNNPKGRMTNRKLSLVHEYALFFGNNSDARISRLPMKPEDKTHNYIKDKDGTWYLPVNLRKQGVDSSALNKKGKLSDRYYPVYFDPKSGKISTQKKLPVEILPIDSTGQKRIWRRSKNVIEQMYKTGDLWAKKQAKNGYQLYYKFRGGLKGQMPQSIWYDAEFSASEYGTQILDKILGEREMFQYPKSPFAVMKSILSGTENKDAVILDFFAGSGTTAHAVEMLNAQDGGNRQFIVCTNNENGIAENVCYPRIKNVINGYKYNGEEVASLPSNLKYYRTGFVQKNSEDKTTDDDRIKLALHTGEMIALRENTLKEKTDETDHYQIFTDGKRHCAIYFREDMRKLPELTKKIAKLEKVALYIFSWTKGQYQDDFAEFSNITVNDIPEPIIEVYKQINAEL